jgi:hypothetical protein
MFFVGRDSEMELSSEVQYSGAVDYIQIKHDENIYKVSSVKHFLYILRNVTEGGRVRM